jgi:hypothetical protein
MEELVLERKPLVSRVADTMLWHRTLRHKITEASIIGNRAATMGFRSSTKIESWFGRKQIIKFAYKVLDPGKGFC